MPVETKPGTTLAIGSVTLVVHDLEGMARFYRTAVGLAEIARATPDEIVLGAGGVALLTLWRDPAAELAGVAAVHHADLHEALGWAAVAAVAIAAFVQQRARGDAVQRLLDTAPVAVVRDGDGTLYALEDNLRIPSGVSYMLENRMVAKRVFPELFETSSILPVDEYPSQLYDTLAALSPRPGDSPVIALLTPGVFNSAYFEHAYLAQAMGINPPSLYADQCGPQPDLPPLRGEARADVAVIGAGYTGLSAATRAGGLTGTRPAHTPIGCPRSAQAPATSSAVANTPSARRTPAKSASSRCAALGRAASMCRQPRWLRAQ